MSWQDTVAAGRAYARRFGVPYPLANDASGRTWAAWGVSVQPSTVIVDKRSRVAKRLLAQTIDPADLDATVAALAAE